MTVRKTICTSYNQCLRKFILLICVLIINIIPVFAKMESLLIVIFLQAISNVDNFVDYCSDEKIEQYLCITCERIVVLSGIAGATSIGLLISNLQWAKLSGWIIFVIKVPLLVLVATPAIVLWHDKKEFRKERR